MLREEFEHRGEQERGTSPTLYEVRKTEYTVKQSSSWIYLTNTFRNFTAFSVFCCWKKGTSKVHIQSFYTNLYRKKKEKIKNKKLVLL